MLFRSIDFIVSDHSPCTPNLKLLHSGDLKNAWGGISSLQFSFSLIWTESLSRNVKLDKLSQLMSHNPAIFCGLDHRKGLIAPGYDADVFVFAPEAEFELRREKIFHKHPETPYMGKKLRGQVLRTYLGGEVVFDDGNFPGEARGKPILKELK